MSSTLRHRQELQRLTPVLDDISGLRWCLIKWTADGRTHGDLDVLVQASHADDFDQLDHCLRQHGYRYEPDPDRYRRKYVHDDLQTEVDIHTAAAWVGIQYLPADWILDTAARERVGDVLVPRPADEADLLIWAAHDMRSNAIQRADVDWCLALAEDADLYVCRSVARAERWGGQFERFIGLCRWLADAPDDWFPYRQPAFRSFKLKAAKAVGHASDGEVGRSLDELTQLIRFDVVRSLL